MDEKEQRFRDQARLRPNDQEAQDRLQRFLHQRNIGAQPLAPRPIYERKPMWHPFVNFLIKALACALIGLGVGFLGWSMQHQGAQFFTGALLCVFGGCAYAIARL